MVLVQKPLIIVRVLVVVVGVRLAPQVKLPVRAVPDPDEPVFQPLVRVLVFLLYVVRDLHADSPAAQIRAVDRTFVQRHVFDRLVELVRDRAAVATRLVHVQIRRRVLDLVDHLLQRVRVLAVLVQEDVQVELVVRLVAQVVHVVRDRLVDDLRRERDRFNEVPHLRRLRRDLLAGLRGLDFYLDGEQRLNVLDDVVAARLDGYSSGASGFVRTLLRVVPERTPVRVLFAAGGAGQLYLRFALLQL